MAWPPPLPSQVLATDVTAQVTRHADDHNKTAAALKELVGNQGTLTNPWRTDTTILPGTGGYNLAYWWRVGPRVFVDTTLSIGTSPTLGTLATPLTFTLPYPISATYLVSSGLVARVGLFQINAVTISNVWGIMDLGATPNRVIYISGTTANVLTGTLMNALNSIVIGQFSYTTDAAP